MQEIYSVWHSRKQRLVVINLVFWQRGRLEQVRQHNEERTAAAMDTNCGEGKSNKDEDGLYEVTLDDDFLTALEYGMPPASGMVWLSFCCILILLGFFLEEYSINDYFSYKFEWVELLLFHASRKCINFIKMFILSIYGVWFYFVGKRLLNNWSVFSNLFSFVQTLTITTWSKRIYHVKQIS